MKIIRKIFIVTFCIFLFLTATITASAYSGYNNSEYVYTSEGKDVVIPDAYIYDGTIALEAKTPKDMFITSDGHIYVSDTGNDRILIYNIHNASLKVLDKFFMSDGSTTTLNKPEGISLDNEGNMFIADTENNRILKCDSNCKVLLEINRPEGMVGTADDLVFYPSKISTDSIGRVYVVARNINQGIICLDSDGNFLSYVGAPKVKYDFIELLWKRFSTKAQKAQMTQYVSTEYNNVFVDSSDFIWGTISALESEKLKSVITAKDLSGQTTPIYKINSADKDILKRNGVYAPVGDLIFENNMQSRIIDVAVTNGGIYSLLDYQRGRIFTYDDNGNLLYAFGNVGNKKGDFKSPSAIGYIGEAVYVLDEELSEISVFVPTAYGRLVNEAVSSQFAGDYEKSYSLWSEVAKENANFEYSFVGLGNVSVSEKEYQRAMEYYKYASDNANYSEAFEYYREEILQKYFKYFFAIIVIWIIVIILRGRWQKVKEFIRR